MKRIRISDIAKRAGVSTATVSYALSNSGRVSRETRERIEKIADAMGFIRDDVAAQLRTGRSSLIGVILNTIVNPFFSELAAALEIEAYEAGYLTLLSTAQNDPVRQRELLSSMVSQGVAGIILSPVHGTGPDLLTTATRIGLPTVVCVRDVPGSGAVFVGADEELSGYLAARHLIEYGHDSLTLIGGYEATTTWQGRVAGIRRAFGEAGLGADACRLVPGPLLPDFAARTLEDDHAAGRMPRAVLCFNDDQAGGAYRAARTLGLSVGEDLSVIGFDNIRQAETLWPGLTSVDIHPGRIGSVSGKMIAQMLSQGSTDVPSVVMRPELVSRGSVARIA